jgi:phosphoribosylanthranilate isomerase
MKLKFCGIRRPEDIVFCNVLEPDYIGMILTPGYRRSVTAKQAAELVKEKKEKIQVVGVFVNPDPEELRRVVNRVEPDVIQLHGSETAEDIAKIRTMTGLPVWKAIRVRAEEDIRHAETLGADLLVLEGFVPGQPGGTGVTANWEVIRKAAPQVEYMLAGGLTPENIRDALGRLQPVGVDLSSGAETEGVKDFEKMKKIVRIVRGE